ncbi:MAG: hypothetical protein A4E57_04543 [Syntrophorhabdaceae bacterium PtaU1.Bin034]|nr:MAG: hypothetical protein A4E57_04543 [Syntrophorhabdaceae bacterium PtaU1.Bin034]
MITLSKRRDCPFERETMNVPSFLSTALIVWPVMTVRLGLSRISSKKVLNPTLQLAIRAMSPPGSEEDSRMVT